MLRRPVTLFDGERVEPRTGLPSSSDTVRGYRFTGLARTGAVAHLAYHPLPYGGGVP